MMRCSLLSLWRASLLLCLGQLLHCGDARVEIEVQAGPLYRVVGTPLYISCSVSGVRSETTDKHFEFRVAKPSRPTNDLNVISSADPNFGYASYLTRVRNNEITVKRLSPNSVRFEIHSLEKSDEGEYECTVVDSEQGYDGTYSDKTTVKVIDNSLSVSSPTSTSLSFNEGEPLTLTCQASTSTIQHTHLSFAWYLRKDGEENAQPIISLNRDFTLIPGQGFEGRYQAGLISLEKLGEATYRLKMAQLELSDQGKIYCQAQEWIQDPDRSWYAITHKDAEDTTLNVNAREVVADTLSLVVGISVQPAILQEGQELLLSCNIDTQDVGKRFFSVAWLRGSVELARIGPTGVLKVGPAYSVREKDGELRATRTGHRDYRLSLKPVRTEDQGEYICRAWPEDRSQDDAFIQGAATDSSSQRVSISAAESGLSVKMQRTVNVTEGGRLQLTCEVDGVKGQLSVTWQHKSTITPTAPYTSVISFTQDGVTEKGEAFMSRKVRVTRPTTDSFILELDEVRLSDSGVYECAVSEWGTNGKTHRQAQTTILTVIPIDKLVEVSLISRNTKVTVGENVKLMCRVKGPRVPVTLTWSVQQDASTPNTILILYSDGKISWSGDNGRYQLQVENRNNEVIYSLIIMATSHREAGTYQCTVSIESVHKRLPASNRLGVNVQNPASKLALSSSPHLTRNINTDIKINCSVIAKTSASSRYSVTWFVQQNAEKKVILSSDQNSVVTFGPQVDLSQRQRISMMCSEGPSFELTIRQAKISDTGSYTCKVEEWLQDPHDEWYRVSNVNRHIELSVTEPANDLHLDEKKQLLTAKEGEEVDLRCTIISGASSASIFYRVMWFYVAHSSSLMNISLVEVNHTGLVSYPENLAFRGLQGRLRLSRPSQKSFHLRIQRVHEEDSGTYWCQVEQYQLDNEAQWQLKASDSGGPIILSVNVTEKNLSIPMEGQELNISRNQDFTIPCDIIKQSSNESKFQVTWFWQKGTETKQRPIFTVYRNSTLHDKFGENIELRFGHPVPSQFSLTVLNPGPENDGLYFCEVEEWLPSLSHGWRKVAVEKSGNLNVSVTTEGNAKAISESECNSHTYIVIIVAVLIISVLVILVLVLKMCRSKTSAGKKSEQSLWAEQPLTTKSGELD